MALVYKHQLSESSFVAIWQSDEDWQKYTDPLNLSDVDKNLLSSMKAFRQKEWLNSRMAFKNTLGKDITLVKDEFGKPWIKDDDTYISISHSEDKVAIIYHQNKVGIDIQIQQEKIIKLAPKFLTQSEIDQLEEKDKLDCFHYYWGAKESLFKAYGRKKVDFKKNLLIEKMDPNNLQPVKGVFQKDDFVSNYTLHFELHNEFYLAYAIKDSI